MIGDCYRELRDFSKAKEYYEKTLEIDPSRLDIHLNLASIALKQKKINLALEKVEALLQAGSTAYKESPIQGLLSYEDIREKALKMKGKLFLKLTSIAMGEKRYSDASLLAIQAANCFKNEIKDPNLESSAYFLWGSSLLTPVSEKDSLSDTELNDAALAQKLLLKTKENPNFSEYGQALYNLGNLYRENKYGRQNLDEAAACYQEAWDKGKVLEALHNLAVIYEEQGELEKSVKTHQEAALQGDADSQVRLVFLCIQSEGKTVPFSTAKTMAEKLGVKDPIGQYLNGLLLSHSPPENKEQTENRELLLEKAIEYLEKAGEAGISKAYLSAGLIYLYQKKDYYTAESYYRQALLDEPEIAKDLLKTLIIAQIRNLNQSDLNYQGKLKRLAKNFSELHPDSPETTDEFLFKIHQLKIKESKNLILSTQEISKLKKDWALTPEEKLGKMIQILESTSNLDSIFLSASALRISEPLDQCKRPREEFKRIIWIFEIERYQEMLNSNSFSSQSACNILIAASRLLKHGYTEAIESLIVRFYQYLANDELISELSIIDFQALFYASIGLFPELRKKIEPFLNKILSHFFNQLDDYLSSEKYLSSAFYAIAVLHHAASKEKMELSWDLEKIKLLFNYAISRLNNPENLSPKDHHQTFMAAFYFSQILPIEEKDKMVLKENLDLLKKVTKDVTVSNLQRTIFDLLEPRLGPLQQEGYMNGLPVDIVSKIQKKTLYFFFR